MTNHTGHDHPATPAGRAACRKATAELVKRAEAFMEDFRGRFGWGWKTEEERERLVRSAAVRLGAITAEQAWGGYDDYAVKFGPSVSAIDALLAIYRHYPDFTMSTFNRMHS